MSQCILRKAGSLVKGRRPILRTMTDMATTNKRSPIKAPETKLKKLRLQVLSGETVDKYADPRTPSIGHDMPRW